MTPERQGRIFGRSRRPRRPRRRSTAKGRARPSARCSCRDDGRFHRRRARRAAAPRSPCASRGDTSVRRPGTRRRRTGCDARLRPCWSSTTIRPPGRSSPAPRRMDSACSGEAAEKRTGPRPVEHPDVHHARRPDARARRLGVLAALKSDPVLASIPVVMLTITDERNLGFSLGAAGRLTKPIGGRGCARCCNAIDTPAMPGSSSSRTTRPRAVLRKTAPGGMAGE